MKSSGRKERKTPSSKQQATSLKRQAIQVASGKRQAPSSKHQATSRKRQAPKHLYPHKVLEASV
jgi:hypothetical protein